MGSYHNIVFAIMVLIGSLSIIIVKVSMQNEFQMLMPLVWNITTFCIRLAYPLFPKILWGVLSIAAFISSLFAVEHRYFLLGDFIYVAIISLVNIFLVILLIPLNKINGKRNLFWLIAETIGSLICLCSYFILSLFITGEWILIFVYIEQIYMITMIIACIMTKRFEEAGNFLLSLSLSILYPVYIFFIMDNSCQCGGGGFNRQKDDEGDIIMENGEEQSGSGGNQTLSSSMFHPQATDLVNKDGQDHRQGQGPCYHKQPINFSNFL